MSYRILLVDGDIASRYRLRLALRGRGHDVETQATAEPVLCRLSNATAGSLPDLLLLGNRLPGMSAIEVLQRLRTTPAMRELPVVLCIGSDDPTLAAIARRDAKVAVLRKDRLEESLDAVLASAQKHPSEHTEVPVTASGDPLRRDAETINRGPGRMADSGVPEVQSSPDREQSADAAQAPGAAPRTLPSSTPAFTPAQRSWRRGNLPWTLPVKLWMLVAACCAALVALGLGLLTKG
jgi:CheY-like chemotaxis protein